MERWIAGTLVLAFVAIVLFVMGRAWAKRRRIDTAAFPFPRVPSAARAAEPSRAGRSGGADAPVAGATFTTQFVAVTLAGKPLERVTAGGLGYRGWASVTVVGATTSHPDAGMLLEVDGAEPLWLAAAALRGVGRGSWAIDRAVEPDGLVVVTADWAGTDVDVYLGPRFDPVSTDFLAAANALLPAHAVASAGHRPTESGSA